MLSAAILPLATAYNVCEGLGFESGVDKRFTQAPVFYACTRSHRGGRRVRADSGLAAVEADPALPGR